MTTTYDGTLLQIGEVEDRVGDTTTVLLDDGALCNGPDRQPLLHLTVQDQTLDDGGDMEILHARGVYTLEEALKLQAAIEEAIERMRALA